LVSLSRHLTHKSTKPGIIEEDKIVKIVRLLGSEGR
jgi:hypothetical protein